MATIEERLAAVEHEYAYLKHNNEELKQKIELHTIAIRALANSAMDSRFDRLEALLGQVIERLPPQR